MDIKRVLVLSGVSLTTMLGGFFLLKPPTKVTTTAPATEVMQTTATVPIEQTLPEPVVAKAAPVKVEYVDVFEPQTSVVQSPRGEPEEHDQDQGEHENGQQDD